jgi:hypothetical protein
MWLAAIVCAAVFGCTACPAVVRRDGPCDSRDRRPRALCAQQTRTTTDVSIGLLIAADVLTTLLLGVAIASRAD